MATTTDVIVLEYQVNLSNLEAGYAKLEKEQKDVQTAAKNTSQEINKGAKQAADSTNEVAKSTTNLKSKLSDLASNLPFANQAKEVVNFSSAVTGIGPAATKASAGVRILSAAFLATGIPILVAAIAGLIAYFKRTDDGATKLAGVMGAFNATLNLITGSFVKIGDATFNALTSVDGFKKGISELGDFLINSLVARITAPITALEGLKLAFQGDFESAGKKLIDTLGQITLGVTDISSKAGEFINEASEAAAAAYAWELAMDALSDKMRDDSKTIAENDAAITKLIIASKNKTIQDEEALKLLDQASALEKQNLAITLQNEQAKLKLIKERNAREEASINQDIKNGETRRSINDDLAQEEIDQEIKIIQIRQSSDNLLEKIQNRRDAKEEEIFQNQIKRIAQEETLAENAAKADYINGVTNAEQLEQALYNIKLKGLQNQKELLVQNGRDIVEVDKAILDLELQNLMKSEKERLAAEKAAEEERQKKLKEFRDAEAKYDEEQKKKREEKEKQHQANLNAIRAAAVDVAQTLAAGLFNNNSEKRKQELDAELQKANTETEQKIAYNQQLLDQGIISQEQFNARKAAIDKQQADKEREIKRKQFLAEKKAALVNIAINTAAAVVKSLATAGIPAGLVTAAIAAALGAAQAAVVASQPTPSFGKGGWIKGKSHSEGGVDINAEGGEFMVKKSAAQKHRQLLESINSDKPITTFDFPGASYKAQRDAYSRREAQANAEKARMYELISNNYSDNSGVERQLRKNNADNNRNFAVLSKEMAKEKYFNSGLFR